MSKILLVFVYVFATGLMADSALAQSKYVKVKEKTNFYSIRGSGAAEFAESMSRNGPFSFQHRSRAWATASRDMSYQLTHLRSKKRCRVKRARVRMTITYTMPKLKNLKNVSGSERRKWKRMYRLLDQHERVHGAYYRQLASKTQRALRRLKPQKTCKQLERQAKKLVESLSEQDRKRNQKFDARDGKNYRRMVRIYSGS